MSTIFDSIGIDPGIIIIALLAIVVILIGVMISNGMRLTRLERKYYEGERCTVPGKNFCTQICTD